MTNPNYKTIKSFPLACKAQGLDADKLIVKWKKNGDTADEIAYKMLKIFIKAINGDWVADYKNADQKKWLIWFWVAPKPKGAGFRVTNALTYWTYTDTSVGSRLCTETEEQIQHAAKYGEQMYLDFNLA